MDILTFPALGVPQKLYISVVSSHMEVDKGRDSSLFQHPVYIFMYKYLLQCAKSAWKKKHVEGRKSRAAESPADKVVTFLGLASTSHEI